MKKIFLFLLLVVSFNVTAQKTYSIEKPLQLNTVNEGAKSDSVLVRGTDKIVKYVPRSEFGGIPADNTLIHTTGNETKTGTLSLITPEVQSGTTGLNAITPLIVTGGAGGSNPNTTGTVIAGNAANISIKSGWGGSVSNVSGTGVSGNGGDIILLSGDGGVAVGTGTILPGRGGNLTLRAGGSRGGKAGMAELKAGNNEKVGAVGGNVYVTGGAGNFSSVSNLLYDGTIFLGVNALGEVRGNTVIGNAVDDRLNRFQVTGSSKFSGTVTANSFVKAGGLPTQYLMADGSVSTSDALSESSGTFTPASQTVGGHTIDFYKSYWVKVGNVVTITINCSLTVTSLVQYVGFSFVLPNSFAINSPVNDRLIGLSSITLSSNSVSPGSVSKIFENVNNNIIRHAFVFNGNTSANTYYSSTVFSILVN